MPTKINSSPNSQPSTITDATTAESSATPAPQNPVQTPTSHQDPQTSAKNTHASKQHAAENKHQQDMRGQLVQHQLTNKLPGSSKNADSKNTTKHTSASAQTNASNAGSESQIKHANVTRRPEGFQFDFHGAVTSEEAAKFIFKDGKVPDGAKIVRGHEGHGWLVQVDRDAASRQNVASHFRAHKEIPFSATDANQFVFTWETGGPSKTSKVSQRLDLQNDFGVTIGRKYKLDEGQRPVEQLGKEGHGYEVKFDKPMTKAEVMEKLFDERKITQGEVKLIPLGPVPNWMWQVEVIGNDAVSALKTPVNRAFTDASTNTRDSLPAGTPSGIRKHFDEKTIPKDAVKHPPDVYIWEQEGHLVHVKTNGKGKEGYYEFQSTKLHPTDQERNDTMRYLMKEKGMQPRQAWKEFNKHWDEIHVAMLGMVAGAGRSLPRDMRMSGQVTNTPRSRNPQNEPVIVTGGAGKNSAAREQSVPKHGTAADSQSPLPPQVPKISSGKGKTLPGSYYNRARRASHEPPPEIPWFPRESGRKLNATQVHAIHEIDSNRIGWSMNRAEHLAQWKHANPNSTEPPPTAFTTRDGRVQVSEEMWVQNGEPALWHMELIRPE